MFWNAKVRISKEMYKNSRKIMSFLRIVGLFPVVVVRSRLGIFLKLSLFSALRSYIVWSLILITAYYGQVENYFVNRKNSLWIKFNTDRIVLFLLIMGHSLVVFGGVFIKTMNCLHFFKYIKCINKVDSIINVTYSKSRKCSTPTIIIIAFSIYSIIILTTDIYMTYTRAKQTFDFVWFLRRIPPFHLVIYLADLIDYSTIFMAFSLKKRLIRLNELLLVEYETSKVIGKIKCSKCRNDQVIYNVLQLAASIVPISYKTCRIISLREALLTLMDATRTLNELLGPNFLAPRNCCRHFPPYCSAIFYNFDNTRKNVGAFDLIIRFLVMLKRISRLLLYIEPWYACSVQLETTKKIISKLLLLNVESQYQKEVRRCAVVLWLRQVTFAACNFFYINRLLYANVVGTVTTYLVIAFQEQIKETN